jgi:photosystem II stability/assembly factor-like uncharacterized protein
MRLKITAICALIALTISFACTKDTTLNSPRPIIHMSVDSLHFVAVAGLPDPPENTAHVLVTNAGADTLRYSVSKKAAWLYAYTLGVAPDTIIVYPLVAGLGSGTYVDTIKVLSNRASNSPQRIIVTFTVLGAMDITPRTLKFHMATGGPIPPDLSLIVSNNVGGELNFSVTPSSGRWIVTPSSGPAPDTVAVRVDTTGLQQGAYLDSLVFSSAEAVNSPIAVACSLHVVSWLPQHAGLIVYLRGLKALDEEHVLAVGFLPNFADHPSCILRTSDGGDTWDAYLDLPGDEALGGIDFLGSQFGCVVGSHGTVARTVNGGSDWTLQTFNDTAVSLWAVKIVSPDTAFAVGTGGSIYRSTDACQNWSRQTTGVLVSLASLHFLNSNTGWVVGNGGTVLYTADAGRSWIPKSLNGLASDLWGITFSDNLHGWIIGAGGVIRATSDGGTTWNVQTSPTATDLRAVDFINATHGWVVGLNGTIIYTENGGSTWLEQASGTNQPLFGIDFVNALRGWTIGDSTVVLTTWSGGR